VAVVLDSDAVIGFLDRDDALHDAADAAVRDVMGEHRILVSAVTYAEVMTGARLGHHDEAAVGGFFVELISVILPVDVPVADRAAEFRARFRSLRMPDALILASADVEASVDLIITGDQQIAKVSGLSCTVRLLG
jgi:predicted nucleic acid-binding protein